MLDFSLSPEQIDLQEKAREFALREILPVAWYYDEIDEADSDESASSRRSGVDETVLAKAVNQALDDDGVGLAIPEVHEIEVTTPGASDELSGIMWESYRGFEVICQHIDLS